MKFCVLLVLSFIAATIESKPVDKSDEFQATNDIEYGKAKKIKKLKSVEEFPIDENSENIDVKKPVKDDVITEGSTTSAPQQFNPFPNLLVPLLQRLQFSPQLFFQDRLNQLKESLGNLGINLPTNNGSTAKQFATTNGLLHLVGLNDSGFYTDRLEPAGFLGGNGWFANKGGILGGPGAILSTGSLLTDYPTPYKK